VPRLAAGPPGAPPPPEESIPRGGRGGGGGEVPPCRGPRRTRLRPGQCRHNHYCRRCRAFASHQRSQSRRRGRPWTSILLTYCRCPAAAVAAAAAAAGAAAAAAAVGRWRLRWHPPLLSLSLSRRYPCGDCCRIRRRCRCRWGGKNLHDCIINFAGTFLSQKLRQYKGLNYVLKI
jgi:hypothetical protein